MRRIVLLISLIIMSLSSLHSQTGGEGNIKLKEVSYRDFTHIKHGIWDPENEFFHDNLDNSVLSVVVTNFTDSVVNLVLIGSKSSEMYTYTIYNESVADSGQLILAGYNKDGPALLVYSAKQLVLLYNMDMKTELYKERCIYYRKD